MLWRTYLLNRLIGNHAIRFIVGRHPIVYAKVLIQYIAVFVVIFFVRKTTNIYFPGDWASIVFATLAGAIYIGGIYSLLRHYFDIIVATDAHLYIVLRDSFFKYRIKVVTRTSIQDISVLPASGGAVLRRDGHILIATEQDDLIEFNHVYNAANVVAEMYDIRDMQAMPHEDLDEHDTSSIGTDDEKFKILVETLGEVIVDYMKKKE